MSIQKGSQQASEVVVGLFERSGDWLSESLLVAAVFAAVAAGVAGLGAGL